MSRSLPIKRPAKSTDIHCFLCDAAVSLQLMAFQPGTKDKKGESVWRGECEGCGAETDARTHGGGR